MMLGSNASPTGRGGVVLGSGTGTGGGTWGDAYAEKRLPTLLRAVMTLVGVLCNMDRGTLSALSWNPSNHSLVFDIDAVVEATDMDEPAASARR